MEIPEFSGRRSIRREESQLRAIRSCLLAAGYISLASARTQSGGAVVKVAC